MASEYTPNTASVREGLVALARGDAARHGDVDLAVVESEVMGQFDRMIAEVERAAAEKALTDAANAVLVSDWWAEDVTNSSGNTCEAVREWLRNRAAAYRREDTE